MFVLLKGLCKGYFMKRFFIVFLIALLACGLCACGSHTNYNQEIEDAYLEGIVIGEGEGYEYGYDEGYAEGYDDGRDDGWNEAVRYVQSEAEHYARECDYWTPEEAFWIIDDYLNGVEGVTEEDYIAAVQTLCYFYEYFYCGMYK